MLIKESKIRKMIRNVIFSEVTNPRMSNIRTMEEEACPYYRDIPAKFATLLSSGTFGEMADTLKKEFPKVASDLGIIGLGSQAGAIQTNQASPSDIGAIAASKNNNGAQILFGYINSYLYASGFGCLQYYYLGLALDFLSTLFGADGDRSKNIPPPGPKNVAIKFLKGIEEKSLDLARDSAGFQNNYAFYVLPILADKGPEYSEPDCVKLLIKDLKNHQSRIDDIRNIRKNSISDTYEEIIDILDLRSTKFAKKINLSEIDRDDNSLAELFKKNAIADLIIALGEARLNYNSVISLNKDFKRELSNFLTKNT
tara:strand:- start:5058 stop:5993 length:936 start_codon:yes stop_codon:yes gene_type:complete